MNRVFHTIVLMLGVASLVGLQSANAAFVVVHHSGLIDPTTEGFTRSAQGTPLSDAGITDDTTDAWHLQFDKNYLGSCKYSYTVDGDTMAQAQALGWSLSAKIRLPNWHSNWTPNDSMVLGAGNGGSIAYYLNFGTDSSGNPIVGVKDGVNSGDFTLTTGTGYHTYDIRVAPGASTASVYVDNSLLVSGWTGEGVATFGAIEFGSWSGSGYNSGLIADVRFTVDPSPIPEPAAIILLGTGLLGLLAYAWRKRK